MPKLAANLTFLFNEVDFLDRFDAAAKAGFKGVEYLFPYDYPSDAIRERLDRNSLKQVLFDLPAGNWAAGDRGIAVDPNRRGEFQDSVGKALEYAKALDTTFLTCLAGKVNTSLKPDQMQNTLIDNLKFASKQLAGTGVTVLLEAINTRDMEGFYLTKTYQARGIVEAVKADNVRIQYDAYHMQVMEGDLAPTIKANMDLIAHFQIADTPGRNEPGTGEINYSFLLPYIDSLGYNGWVGCEYRPKGRTQDSFSWAQKWLR